MFVYIYGEGYLHRTFTVCVDTTFSVSCIFRPWQMTTNERLLGSMTAVIFEMVIHPPVVIVVPPATWNETVKKKSGNLLMLVYMQIRHLYCRYLPSGLTTVRDVALRIWRPPTVHLISAGGFDGAVVHVSGTTSPTRASLLPDMETCVGATKSQKRQRDTIKNKNKY